MQRTWQFRVFCASLELVVFALLVTGKSVTYRKELRPQNDDSLAELLLQRELHLQSVKRSHGSHRVNLSNYCLYPSRHAIASLRYPSRYASLPKDDVSDGIYTKTYEKVSGEGEIAYPDGLPNPRIHPKTIRRFEASDNSLSIPVVQGKGLYRAEIYVGTPGQKLLLELDTGSDLTWIKCRPGVSCQDGAFGNKLFFDPKSSSTFQNFYSESLFDQGENGKTFSAQCITGGKSPACNFFQEYADGSSAGGELVTERITLPGIGGTNTTPLALGCESSSEGNFETGLLGLGRGKLSLPTQIGEHYGNRFAYCLSIAEGYNTSFLRFGEAASPSAPGMKFLSMIRNSKHPSFYYLGLEGLSVGGELLQLPRDVFSINEETGDGGVVLDSGTTFTFLPQAVYVKMTEAFEAKMLLPRTFRSVKLDLCFSTSGETSSRFLIPRVVLHFRADERLVDIELPPENFLRQVAQDKLCLAVLPTHGPQGSPAVIGNMFQRNFHILIDSQNNSVGFLGPKVCNEDGHRYMLAEAIREAIDISDPSFMFAIALFVPASLLSSLLISLVSRGRNLQHSFGWIKV